MSENKLPKIPKEWKWVRLEGVVNIFDSMRIPLNQQERNKKKKKRPLYPYYGATGKVDEIDDYIFDGEYILLGEDGVQFLDKNKRKAYIVRGKFWANNHVHILKTINGVKNFYLMHYLNIFDYHGYVTGTTRLKLNQSAMKNIPIPLSPLPEQQKIVEILEEAFSKIDAGVEGLKKIKKLLSLYRQAVLKYAFEGKLTEEWRKQNKDKLEPADKLIEKIKKEREERYKQELEEWKKACEIAKKEGKKKPPKPKPPKELPPITEEELKNLPEIPKEWKWVRLGEVGTVYSGGTPSTKVPSYWGDEIPWITPADLSGYKHKYISKGRKSITKLGLENSSAVLMPAGTVLFSSRAPIGYVAIASNPVSTNQGFKSIYPYKSILSDFIYYYLKFAKEIIENMGSGTTFKEVSAKVFNLIPFPLLSLPEQQKIIEEIEYRLSIADKLEETVDKLLEKADKLKQSYLKYAFEGKLTEKWRKQNPHLVTGENSVDKLLEKIKAEKEKFERQKKESKKIQRKKKMKEKPKNLSILEVLEENGGEMDSKEVWKASKYSDNIEKFYEELKELYLNKKIEEQKTERGSILRLKR